MGLLHPWSAVFWQERPRERVLFLELNVPFMSSGWWQTFKSNITNKMNCSSTMGAFFFLVSWHGKCSANFTPYFHLAENLTTSPRLIKTHCPVQFPSGSKTAGSVLCQFLSFLNLFSIFPVLCSSSGVWILAWPCERLVEEETDLR